MQTSAVTQQLAHLPLCNLQLITSSICSQLISATTRSSVRLHAMIVEKVWASVCVFMAIYTHTGYTYSVLGVFFLAVFALLCFFLVKTNVARSLVKIKIFSKIEESLHTQLFGLGFLHTYTFHGVFLSEKNAWKTACLFFTPYELSFMQFLMYVYRYIRFWVHFSSSHDLYCGKKITKKMQYPCTPAYFMVQKTYKQWSSM